MGKTYIDTVKYLVYANVDIEGLVEKPDVVGAVFGQTEGLLGDELDLRELQKNGRIGRIEVDLQPRGGRSVGKIKLPSSLDMVETCILAAALETVDRVGPCEARIGVEKIEDTRNSKRKVLVDRAKTLLKSMLTNEIPESKEISEMVRQEVKVAEISEYGPEKLPCGPNIEKADSIVIVEGRADVLVLLKNDITNVVAVGGANVTNAIAKLAREKEVTVFLDGDRGGDIILNELSRVADIDFVARAPAGKEVEELSRKELIKCLRAKVPFESASSPAPSPGGDERRGGNEYRERDQRGGRRERYDDRRRDDRREAPRREEPNVPAQSVSAPLPMPVQQMAQQEMPVPSPPADEPAASNKLAEVPAPLLSSLDELENTLRARFYKSLAMSLGSPRTYSYTRRRKCESGASCPIFFLFFLFLFFFSSRYFPVLPPHRHSARFFFLLHPIFAWLVRI
ncbi:MAG: DNA primase DnaG [Candidatus Micrarchaeota archaeon]|nr:DNA primase DnaG [Candidatus Micrarchaeota archaeon]